MPKNASRVVITRAALDEFLAGTDKKNKVPEPVVVPEPEVPIQPIEPNAQVVDSSQPQDFPIDDPNFVPLNIEQLTGSVAKMLKSLGNDKIIETYQRIKKLVAEINEPISSMEMTNANNDHLRPIQRTGSEGPKSSATKRPISKPGVSEHVLPKKNAEPVRKLIRAYLNEVFPIDLSDLDDPPKEPPEPGYKMDYHEISKELGFSSPSAARLIIEKALLKLRFLIQLSSPKREELILRGVKDYIYELASTGEISEEEVDLLFEHPSIVASLDGFRNFLSKYIIRAMRVAGIKGWDDSEFRKKTEFEG